MSAKGGMKRTAAHYEARAEKVIDTLVERKNSGDTVPDSNALVNVTLAQVWATLAVAAATLEADRRQSLQPQDVTALRARSGIRVTDDNREDVEVWLGQAFETHLPSLDLIEYRGVDGVAQTGTGDLLRRNRSGDVYASYTARRGVDLEDLL